MTEECPDCPPEEGEPELTEAQKIILNLNRANNAMIKRIEKATGGQVDVSGERHEEFINRLVDWGIVSREQMEQFNLWWVDHLNSKLMKLEADIRARQQQALAEERAAAQQAQLAARQRQSPGLIVPGHLRGQNGTGRRGGGR